MPVADVDAAWSQFHDAMDHARESLMASPRHNGSPQARSEAHAALLETVAMAYNIAMAPFDHPARVSWGTTWHSDIYTVGLPCRDFKYGTMALDGTRTYRLSARLGQSRMLLVQGHSHIIGDPRSVQTGSYDLHDFEAEDGSITIVASAEPHEGNWIRLDASSSCNFFLIRDILADWGDDPGDLRVEPIDAGADRLGSAASAEAVVAATNFMAHHVKQLNLGFHDLCVEVAGGRNQFGRMPGADVSSSLMGSPVTIYDVAAFQVDPDDALVVEFQAPDAHYWSLQVGDAQARALDFRHHQTDINMTRAVTDGDGRVRVVLAGRDPGVANWLDTDGRGEGVVLMRSYGNRSAYDVPTARRVERSRIPDLLGGTTEFVTADERSRRLAERERGTARLFGR